ncbi:MAG: sn-glycerol-3-phosphate ABC transporter ATP-binding protein UgpC [Mesorhizobium sp.]
MAEVVLVDVAKRYKALDVITGLSLTMNDGEFVVIVGPSGCGKSTLLRMIAGLETISGGDLLIGGRRANDLPPQKRNIAMVFQTYALFPHLTVAENIAFGPQVRGEPAASVRERVERAAAVLNLTPYLHRRPSELSGGQRQRVAMGRSIVRDPDVFLFDEPLSNLDAHLRVDMRAEIKSLHKKLGSTIVYVTHDQVEAMTMADRIVIMHGGRIEQVGTPTDLYDRPVNKFVAGFLGSPSMSFLSGRFVRGGSGGSVRLGDDRSVPVAKTRPDGEDVTIGIRPEAFEIDSDGPIHIVVEVIEPTGAEIMIYGRVAGEVVRCVFRGRPKVELGQTLRARVHPDLIHLFDNNTGQRF